MRICSFPPLFFFLFYSCILPFSMVFAATAPQTSSILEIPKRDSTIVTFTPPPGWSYADQSKLPPSVKIMVVGPTTTIIPPSMNLAMQPYHGTLKDYLKMIKERNEAKGEVWKDLGSIRTVAGKASLSQGDCSSQWGPTRQMHTILIKNGTIYILTASAAKDEFQTYYKDFFTAMRSLRVLSDPFEMISLPQQKAQLKSAVEKVKTEWAIMLKQQQPQTPESKDLTAIKEHIFASEQFQNKVWNSFSEMLKQKYPDLGIEWRELLLNQVKTELFDYTE